MPGLVATGLNDGVNALPNDEKADVNIAFFDELIEKLKLNRKRFRLIYIYRSASGVGSHSVQKFIFVPGTNFFVPGTKSFLIKKQSHSVQKSRH